MDCPACSTPLKPNAKFCGACGAKIASPEAKSATAVCPACTAPLKPNAKFCGACGAKVGGAAAPPAVALDAAKAADKPPAPAPDNTQDVNGFLIWNLPQGAVAQTLTAKSLAEYGSAKGVVVHEGTTALIFIDGRLEQTMTAGSYRFPKDGGSGGVGAAAGSAAAAIGGAVGTAVTAVASGVAAVAEGAWRLVSNLWRSSPEIAQPVAAKPAEPARKPVPRGAIVSILLVRAGPLPLQFDYKGMPTASISTDVTIEALLTVKDAAAFMRSVMADCTVVGIQALSTKLTPLIHGHIQQALASFPAEKIGPDPSLQNTLAVAIRAALGNDWAFLSVDRVSRVASKREDLDRLRGLREELWIQDRELEQLSARQDFENRLRMEENRKKVNDAKTAEDLARQLQEIGKDTALREDDLEKFNLLLQNEKLLRVARTEEEKQAALAGIRKSTLVREDDMAKMELSIAHERRVREAKVEEQYQAELHALGKDKVLRQDEMESLKRRIAERVEDESLGRSHSLAMLDLGRRLEVDKAKLQWESEIGDQRIELELARKRKAYAAKAEFAGMEIAETRVKDDYSDERRQKDAAFEDQRRKAALDADQQEMLNQLDVARRAQELSESRKKADHDRDMAAAAQIAQQQREMKLVEAQRWAGMSVDQIMAANPDLNPAAATALQEKFKGEAAAMAEKYKAEAAANGGDIRAQAANDKVAMAEKQKDEMKEFMQQQMAMMQNMMQTALQTNAQVATAQVQDRQRQLEQARGDADRREERIVDLTGRTASAVAGATGAGVAGSRTPVAAAAPVCTKCGKPVTAKFCEDCGP
jgi:hypothetical protein